MHKTPAEGYKCMVPLMEALKEPFKSNFIASRAKGSAVAKQTFVFGLVGSLRVMASLSSIGEEKLTERRRSHAIVRCVFLIFALTSLLALSFPLPLALSFPLPPPGRAVLRPD